MRMMHSRSSGPLQYGLARGSSIVGGQSGGRRRLGTSNRTRHVPAFAPSRRRFLGTTYNPIQGQVDCFLIDLPATIVCRDVSAEVGVYGCAIPAVHINLRRKFSLSDTAPQLLRVPTCALADFRAGDPVRTCLRTHAGNIASQRGRTAGVNSASPVYSTRLFASDVVSGRAWSLQVARLHCDGSAEGTSARSRSTHFA